MLGDKFLQAFFYSYITMLSDTDVQTVRVVLKAMIFRSDHLLTGLLYLENEIISISPTSYSFRPLSLPPLAKSWSKE